VNEVLLLLSAPADSEVRRVPLVSPTQLLLKQNKKVELLLSYVVMGAAWQAAYDVRVQSDNEQLDLTYYGIITNNSLDDWTDVRESSLPPPSPQRTANLFSLVHLLRLLWLCRRHNPL